MTCKRLCFPIIICIDGKEQDRLFPSNPSWRSPETCWILFITRSVQCWGGLLLCCGGILSMDWMMSALDANQCTAIFGRICLGFLWTIDLEQNNISLMLYLSQGSSILKKGIKWFSVNWSAGLVFSIHQRGCPVFKGSSTGISKRPLESCRPSEKLTLLGHSYRTTDLLNFHVFILSVFGSLALENWNLQWMMTEWIIIPNMKEEMKDKRRHWKGLCWNYKEYNFAKQGGQCCTE